ncbi:heavy metal translocating P-type ATPase [Marinivivus vitaminiproducens]|uniref:heavy metal translocating P-type ATPase n=1 Tax=Marinivivus vitaminiproducens TaxID=3035935 RepID=UPI0027A30BF7|nr:heavy metal translocating P-type ATPase [Geminicoccaceae bacterium SCSIO 64248]
MASTLQQSRFDVRGMDCASCAAKIETALRRLPGVHEVGVSVARGTLTVEATEAVTAEAVIGQVARLGYSAEPAGRAEPGPLDADPTCCGAGQTGGERRADGHPRDEGDASWWRSPRVRLTAASGAALVLAYGLGHMVPAVALPAFLAALLVGLVPVATRAFTAARLGTPFSIEMLMTIAAVGAVIIGATEEAAAVVFLFLVGEMLEGVAAGRARAGIRALGDLVPKVARVEQDGGVVEMPAERVAAGAVIVVRPGDRVPADGEILSGTSAIDQAPVTGESTPVTKAAGDAVFAGTVNQDGVLRVRVTAAAEDNTIARIIRLVEDAQESKAPTERFIDRFSKLYTPGVVVVALLTAVLPPLVAGEPWSEWIYKSLALLLIACPCALVISTPAAIAASLSTGARRGLLMKGGAVLEALAGITTVAFDKTGTLTEGRPAVTDVVAFDGSEDELVRLAGALEAGSSHPLAQAILTEAGRRGLALPAVEDGAAAGGKGVTGTVGSRSLFLGSASAAFERGHPTADQERAIEALRAQGRTVAVLVADRTLIGVIALRDEPRADAKAALATLRGRGIGSLMLTGDNRQTAEAVAAQLGIEARAELLPEDKQRIVGELQARGERVAKVGDGINDAPALAAADVGIAMGGGADVALETGDAAVLHGRVTDVPALLALARDTLGNIRQNIAIALGLKAVFLVTTLAGITGLWPAILADTGATVLVTANAMRLLRWRPSAM